MQLARSFEDGRESARGPRILTGEVFLDGDAGLQIQSMPDKLGLW